jgi:hypothetical protein
MPHGVPAERSARPSARAVQAVARPDPVPGGARGHYGAPVDHQTRVERGQQELFVVFCLLLAGEAAVLLVALVARRWETAVMAGVLCVTMGSNVYGQRRRRPAEREKIEP